MFYGTGCQWNTLPRSWEFQDVTGYVTYYSNLWNDGLSVYKKTGINWKWQAMDGIITKAPLGGKIYRRKSHRQR